jgi:lantibiotic modifying enzyme
MAAEAHGSEMNIYPLLDRAQLQPLGYGLYSGICGVALFLSALEHIEGKGRLQNIILSTLKPLFLDIEDSLIQ